MDSLVSACRVSAHLNDPDLVVICCENSAEWSQALGQYQTTSGQADWQAAHIPSSRYADFTKPGFAGDAAEYRNSLPTPEGFATAMARLDPESPRLLPQHDLAVHLPDDRDQRAIVYCGSGIAAALVGFAMMQTGFEDVAIYMSGLQEWMNEPPLPQSHA